MENQDAPAGSQPAATGSTVAAVPARTSDAPPAPQGGKTREHAASGATVRRVRVSAWLVRWVALFSGAVAIGLTGWQTARVIDEQVWSAGIATAALAAAIVGAIGLLLWTWIVVENARRLLAIASSHRPPDPIAAVMAWLPALIVASAAGASVIFVQSRLRDSTGDESSPIPLAIALVSIIATLLVTYRPIFVLSGVTRRLGIASSDLARWYWVPIALTVVGSLSLVAMNLGGAYGDDFDGVAPAWALAVAAIPPTIIVFGLALRGSRAVEESLSFAFARRAGDLNAGIGRGRMGLMARALRADARPPIDRDLRQRIRLVPGSDVLRLALVTTVAALALLSIVGAVVMFLFWREASDGTLIQSQEIRAWDTLHMLQRVERVVAAIVLLAAAAWSFVIVMNARLSTGRRRNPVLVLVAWPAAAFGVWRVADQIAGDDRVAAVVSGFVLQAAIMYVPFFLLERSAMALHCRRQPIRFAYALGVILLVHTQGLVGLSTLDEGATTDQFGRIAGYLALAALMQLVSTLAITEASNLMTDAATNEATQHNFLAEQRRSIDKVAAAKQAQRPAQTAQADASTAAGSPAVIAASSPPQF